MNSSLNIKQKLNCGNQYHRLLLHNEKELTIHIYNWVGSQKCYIEWESKNGNYFIYVTFSKQQNYRDGNQ